MRKIILPLLYSLLATLISKAETVEYYVDGTKIGEATNNTSLV